MHVSAMEAFVVMAVFAALKTVLACAGVKNCHKHTWVSLNWGQEAYECPCTGIGTNTFALFPFNSNNFVSENHVSYNIGERFSFIFSRNMFQMVSKFMNSTPTSINTPLFYNIFIYKNMYYVSHFTSSNPSVKLRFIVLSFAELVKGCFYVFKRTFW